MTTPQNKGREAIRRQLRAVFVKRKRPPSTYPEGTALRPCPKCGQHQWLFGLIEPRCGTCGATPMAGK
jgi:hypothetical protein